VSTLGASERRRRLIRRGLPALAAIAALALVAGLVVGGGGRSEGEHAGKRFADAWERGDYAAMHRLLTADAQRRTTVAALAAAYQRAAATATVTTVTAGRPSERDGSVRVPVTITTRAFGTVRGHVDLPTEDGRIDWRPELAFPGLGAGEQLSRSTRVPRRAAILARDGERIASGPATARRPGSGAVAEIAGTLGSPATDEERDALDARGFPPATPVGHNGLERILEQLVAGTPGGTLRAGGRVVARTRPRPAHAVKTTIDTRVQEAAVAALAGRFGGVAALDPRSAEVRALAGIAFSAPQPPGSTFKIVTATAALDARLVRRSTPFPVGTEATVGGFALQNANGESCGGSFADSFAHSCNSVFAPLGVKIGAKRLVATAERFGFNRRPSFRGAAASTLPRAREMESKLEVATTAIGQGKVLATPLQLASMAQTVAAGGVRRDPTVLPRARPGPGVRVTSRRVARTLERLMIGVVSYGTGVRASLAPVKVAGKTGTAELEQTVRKKEEPPPGEQAESPELDTDAWFTGYAPVRRPRLAVAVLLVRAGAGGDTAAPAARGVLQAGLR
jgi:transpeptidase family protein/MecA-like transpeptidase family protein